MRFRGRLVCRRFFLRFWFFGQLDARAFHGAKYRARFFLRVDPEFAAAIDVQPVEIAVVFEVNRRGVLVPGDGEAALDQRALQVILGLVPLFGKVVHAHAHAGTALIAAKVRFDGVEKIRQLFFLGGGELIPLVFFLLGRIGIGVVRGGDAV